MVAAGRDYQLYTPGQASWSGIVGQPKLYTIFFCGLFWFLVLVFWEGKNMKLGGCGGGEDIWEKFQKRKEYDQNTSYKILKEVSKMSKI